MNTRVQNTPETRTITAAEFKAKCLQLMDEVNEKQITLIVTKRGKPVMEAIAPRAEAKPFRSIVGRTPGIRVPSAKEWAKHKAEFAAEWDDSLKKFQANLQISDRKKRKKS